jgi:hypothetical protein
MKAINASDQLSGSPSAHWRIRNGSYWLSTAAGWWQSDRELNPKAHIPHVFAYAGGWTLDASLLNLFAWWRMFGHRVVGATEQRE